jgi:S-adenosylmethionine-diacylglycerol 3-amino-3-carboxypropyl transferase
MKKQLNSIKDEFFSKVHRNNLVYNTCWEDPKLDRDLLELDDASEVVMITSAGCNALDYLLDNPGKIHAVDVNYRQNALLELKRELFKRGDFKRLFSFFGKGHDKNANEYYQNELRKGLPEYAQEFWDEKLFYFFKNDKKRSFYFFGTAGSFAWLLNKYLHAKKKRFKLIIELFACTTLEEQRKVYSELEPVLINKFVRWLMNRHLTMSLLGVPRPQRRLILEEFPDGGVGEFVAQRLKHIFTELPIQENYFWYLYTFGRYSKSNCPEYLRKENFETIAERERNLVTHTCTVQKFLEDNPKEYSHYILLDHQDWLAHHDPEALISEWKEILKNSRSGTKILLRSASMEVQFFPDFVKDAVEFSPWAQAVHQLDRVGTYGSTYLAVVK